MEEMMQGTAISPEMEVEIERRIREALEQARGEWAAETAQAVADTERLASMSDSERADYNLSRREAALAERERRLLERELRAMALEKLAERGLPVELADALPYTDEAKCLSAIDSVERAFRAAVQAAVDERLRGGMPVTGGRGRADADSLSDAEYYNLSGMGLI